MTNAQLLHKAIAVRAEASRREGRAKLNAQIPERKIHLIRWLLTSGWTILILSAFYDPLSFLLTDPNNLLSPLHIHPEQCVLVQSICLPQSSYVLAPRLFWGIIVPLSLIIIVVGGHETWRRICPLSFISQIPRRLGIGRKRQRINRETGVVRQELVGIDANSWLGKNSGYLQFALFFIGLNIRLLVANGSGLGFGLFLVVTVAAAITIGWLYKGKSWCQYFCPMAPVQIFYTGTRGLLGSYAHLSPAATITQSMCRTIDDKGREKSACVGCQSHCFDIDAERTYWATLNNPDQQLLFYGYFGLMLGFFVYFYLYAGNWDYYYSGFWSHDPTQLTSLLSTGFYIADRTIPIPKIIAAPLTLGIFTLASYGVGKGLENIIQRFRSSWSEQQVRHICYVFAVFVSFNVFFIFAGQPNFRLLPDWTKVVFNSFLIAVSTIWLQRNLRRSQSLYQRESLAGNLRRQLQKLKLNWVELLQGRSLEQLANEEVYVLAKVLPSLNRHSQIQVYRGVLQEALSEGKTSAENSLDLLQDIRQQLVISPEEHYEVLHNLGLENPSLLALVQPTPEDELRVAGYRDRLELLLADSVATESIEQTLESHHAEIHALRFDYQIDAAEQERVLLALFHPSNILVNISTTLLEELRLWRMRHEAFTHLPSDPQRCVDRLLRTIVADRTNSIVTQLLNLLELLADEAVAKSIAQTTAILAPQTTQKLLPSYISKLSPQSSQILLGGNSSTALNLSASRFHRLSAAKIENLAQITQIGTQSMPQLGLLNALQDLLQDSDSITKAASLLALSQIMPQYQVGQIVPYCAVTDPLVEQTIDLLQKHSTPTLTIDLECSGQQSRQVFVLGDRTRSQQSVVKIGRASDNDLVILDKRVSHYHAVFEVDADRIVVRDVSRYGLWFDERHLRREESPISNDTKLYFSPSKDLFMRVNLSITNQSEQTITTLEKLLWLRYSRAFESLNERDLISIARNSSLRTYKRGDIISRSIQSTVSLLLIDGVAQSSDKKCTFTPGEIIKDYENNPRISTTEFIVTSRSLDALLIKIPSTLSNSS
jgi:pSer/pThr/pTyr-binding forkhead associated (FHA) protein